MKLVLLLLLAASVSGQAPRAAPRQPVLFLPRQCVHQGVCISDKDCCSGTCKSSKKRFGMCEPSGQDSSNLPAEFSGRYFAKGGAGGGGFSGGGANPGYNTGGFSGGGAKPGYNAGGFSGGGAKPGYNAGGFSGGGAKPGYNTGGFSGGGAKPGYNTGGFSGGGAKPGYNAGGFSGGGAKPGYNTGGFTGGGAKPGGGGAVKPGLSSGYPHSGNPGTCTTCQGSGYPPGYPTVVVVKPAPCKDCNPVPPCPTCVHKVPVKPCTNCGADTGGGWGAAKPCVNCQKTPVYKPPYKYS